MVLMRGWLVPLVAFEIFVILSKLDIVCAFTYRASLAHAAVRHSSHLKSTTVGGASETERSSTKTDFCRDEYAFIQDTYNRYPMTVDRGKGCKLFDDAGKEYLDFSAGIATTSLGHADNDLVKAVSEQMSKLNHVGNLYYIPNQGRLARWLVENSPCDRAFFCNSGAEANEAALKLARKYGHERLGLDEPIIITARHSFHGRTIATLTATGQPKYQKSFGPLLPGIVYCDYNDPAGLRQLVNEINFKGWLGGLLPGFKKSGVAAVLLEPLQGEGGILPATNEFFKSVREICDRTGALMMCDEVQTGVGRTGRLWGFENLNVEPDVFTTAKALAGGLPIGAMLCKDSCDMFSPGDHASTFGGNPLSCAAGLVVGEKLTKEGLLDSVVERGNHLKKGLDALVQAHSDILELRRGWGLIQGIVLRKNTLLSSSAIASKALELGLLVVPAGPEVTTFFWQFEKFLWFLNFE